MLVQLLLTISLLSGIYFVTRRLFALLFRCVYRITGNKRVSVWIVAFILLPGTIVHELSHFLVATVLRVHTGQISVFPTKSHMEGVGEDETLMGHVQIAQSGPIRHTLIGTAPLLIGLFLIFFIGHIFFPAIQLTTHNSQLKTIIGIYMLFVISSTMFSSRSDLRSFIFVGPVVSLLTIAIYLSGIRISVTQNLQETMVEVAKRLNFSLAVSGAIDAAILLLLRLVLWGLLRIKHLVKG